MDPISNPYSPGAGKRPPALVGRDDQIEAFDVAVRRLALGRSDRSQMLTGLRGVGKTVLLREFRDIAVGHGWCCQHVEIGECDDFVASPRLWGAERPNLHWCAKPSSPAVSAIPPATTCSPSPCPCSTSSSAATATDRQRRPGRGGQPVAVSSMGPASPAIVSLGPASSAVVSAAVVPSAGGSGTWYQPEPIRSPS